MLALLALCFSAASGLAPPLRARAGVRRNARHARPLTMAVRIPWRNVFLAEYAGPLAVFPAVLAVQGVRLEAAAVPLALWSVHFAKRVLETLFVHSFSKSSMPVSNLFKNCGYYWGFAAAVAWDVGRMEKAGVLATKMPFVVSFFAFELLNLYSHAHLASLRSDGSRDVVLPTWLPFRYVTSPNYTFEILSWAAFTAAFHSPVALLFTAVGAAQMAVWSKQKLKRYQKKFNGDLAFTAKHALLPGVY
ncbi:3-oxo-5-alpha-steroid 4-dehydrogenase-domain-containing protein [Pelagophyceae sp. CCMP2097]|nr:3-oxo-5-alpha-steroid 4-dehydrogenase-domain-containing protein [Pelagophyceae sp. CCMP2097]|mmetsp:Transcript_24579/g.82736  ORF Transcript_24579/g.82736 Transcript_24579/m.82736 type:complete len:247 (+) Transcript_24579:52-792(+)